MKMTNDNIFTMISIALIAMQGFVTNAFQGIDNVYATGVVLALSAVCLVAKQRISIEVKDKKALKYSTLLIAIAIFGGFNDAFKIHVFSTWFEKFLQMFVAVSFALLNYASKFIFPTPAARDLQSDKQVSIKIERSK